MAAVADLQFIMDTMLVSGQSIDQLQRRIATICQRHLRGNLMACPCLAQVVLKVDG